MHSDWQSPQAAEQTLLRVIHETLQGASIGGSLASSAGTGQALRVIVPPRHLAQADALIRHELFARGFALFPGGLTKSRSAIFGFGRFGQETGWRGIQVILLSQVFTHSGVALLSAAPRKIGLETSCRSETIIWTVLDTAMHGTEIRSEDLRDAAEILQSENAPPLKDLAETGNLFAPDIAALLRDQACDTAPTVKSEGVSQALETYVRNRRPLASMTARVWKRIGTPYRLLRAKGLMLVFLGTDGAGKSTITEALSDFFRLNCDLATQTRHVRPRVLPPLKRLLGKSEGTNTGPRREQMRPSAGPLSIVRLIWLFSDFHLGYWFVVKSAFGRGLPLFVFDRYADDMILNPDKFRVSLPSAVRRMFCATVPQPDIKFCFTADPSLIAARKPEIDPEAAVIESGRIREIAAHDPRSKLIETNGTPQDAIEETLCYLHDWLRDKHRD